MMEIWKDIVGYETYYQISNKGEVKSKDRVARSNKGYYTKNGRILKQIGNSRGYLRVMLWGKDKKQRMFVHRLVAETYIPNLYNKPCINHMDSNPHNNNVENLEWVTHLENMHHAINNGRFDKHYEVLRKALKESNERQRMAVIGTNIVTNATMRFDSINEAGRRFNGAAGDISCCCRGIRFTARGYRWEYAN